jgi:hypothetical protein
MRGVVDAPKLDGRAEGRRMMTTFHTVSYHCTDCGYKWVGPHYAAYCPRCCGGKTTSQADEIARRLNPATRAHRAEDPPLTTAERLVAHDRFCARLAEIEGA